MTRANRLLECPRCGAASVVPVDWHEHDDARWWMRLRCGECGRAREAIVDDSAAQAYGRELDRGVAEIAVTALELERARIFDEAYAANPGTGGRR